MIESVFATVAVAASTIASAFLSELGRQVPIVLKFLAVSISLVAILVLADEGYDLAIRVSRNVLDWVSVARPV